jgi:hypothetical protein
MPEQRHISATQTQSLLRQPLIRQAKMTPQRLVIGGLLLVCGLGTIAMKQPLPGSHQVISRKDVDRTAKLDRAKPQDEKPKVQTLQFAPGEISQIQTGVLQENQPQIYRLRASASQVMTVMLDGSARMTLLRSDGSAIDKSAEQTRRWTGQMPADELYEIRISGSGSYSLDLVIAPKRPARLQSAQQGKRQNPEVP